MTAAHKAGVAMYSKGYDTTIRQIQSGMPAKRIRENVERHANWRRWGGSVNAHIENAQKASRDIEDMFEGMQHRLPEMKVYRGLSDVTREAIDKMLATSEVTFDAVTSTSRSPAIARDFASARRHKDRFSVMIVIDQKTGVGIERISKYRSEQEILMRKGSKLRVKKFEKVLGSRSTPPQLWMHLEEI